MDSANAGNRRTGLGYGIVLYGDASALIEKNTFTQNHRHDIAGSQRWAERRGLAMGRSELGHL
ncbi:hypothetical protein [Catelliglobosispora koreensis]|uniref:hypothetical protein n=1 Tax=Catelliglobosispora koreensis TaxID=129052 RepID=UPI000360E2AA|nr:hypothetical protein [Catelliglobosispora koreensis]